MWTRKLIYINKLVNTSLYTIKIHCPFTPKPYHAIENQIKFKIHCLLLQRDISSDIKAQKNQNTLPFNIKKSYRLHERPPKKSTLLFQKKNQVKETQKLKSKYVILRKCQKKTKKYIIINDPCLKEIDKNGSCIRKQINDLF